MKINKQSKPPLSFVFVWNWEKIPGTIWLYTGCCSLAAEQTQFWPKKSSWATLLRTHRAQWLTRVTFRICVKGSFPPSFWLRTRETAKKQGKRNVGKCEPVPLIPNAFFVKPTSFLGIPLYIPSGLRSCEVTTTHIKTNSHGHSGRTAPKLKAYRVFCLNPIKQLSHFTSHSNYGRFTYI